MHYNQSFTYFYPQIPNYGHENCYPHYIYDVNYQTNPVVITQTNYYHPNYICDANNVVNYSNPYLNDHNLNPQPGRVVINQQSLFEPRVSPPRSIARSFCDKFYNFTTVALFGCCI
jgi:hypothetical protein